MCVAVWLAWLACLAVSSSGCVCWLLSVGSLSQSTHRSGVGLVRDGSVQYDSAD